MIGLGEGGGLGRSVRAFRMRDEDEARNNRVKVGRGTKGFEVDQKGVKRWIKLGWGFAGLEEG